MQLNELKSLLSRYHVRPDKKLGQNFLLSEKVLDEIIEAAELKSTDIVLEIGAGLGALTARLAERAGEVIAIEKDRKLAQALRKMFKNKKNVKIVNEDILFMDSSVILRYSEGSRDSSATTPQNDKRGDWIPGQARNDKLLSYKIVANIPYYITGKLLQNFLSPSPRPSTAAPSPEQGEGYKEEALRPSLMVLLLQKEVAERIVAKPGEMSILAVSVQFYADAEIISYVGKDNFYPVPEVDSAVVRLRVLDKPRFTPPSPSPSQLRQGYDGQARGGKEEGIDEREFFRLVKVGFSNKRKQLQNNLASGFTLPSPLPSREGNKILIPPPRGGRLGGGDYKMILESLGLNPLCRAQDLSLADWKRLFDKLT